MSACPECGKATVAGVEVRGVYDGVLFWSCIACGARWHRFEEGSALRTRAEPFVEGRPG